MIRCSDMTFHIDFVGIGDAKAATTWIFECLKEHPEICGSSVKETMFFNKCFDRGLRWYKQFFAHCPVDSVKGEFTPNYLNNAQAPHNIYSVFPEAKLIVCFRNPIERFLSSYYSLLVRQKYFYESIEQYLKTNPENTLEKCLNAKNLSRYLELFPRENICILLYDDVLQDPQTCIQDIYRFLNVDDTYNPPSLTQRKNVTAKDRVRFPLFHKLFYRSYKFLRKNSFSPVLVPMFKRLRIHKLGWKMYRLNERPEEKLIPLKKNPKPETIQYLKKYYHKDIKQLEQLLERDLSAWY